MNLIKFVTCVGLVAAEKIVNVDEELIGVETDRVIIVYPETYCNSDEQPRVEALRYIETVLVESQTTTTTAVPGAGPLLSSRYLKSVNMEIALVPEWMTASNFLQIIESAPCVEYVSPDGVRYPDGILRGVKDANFEEGPTDPEIDQQWYLGGDWGINALEAHSEWQGNRDMIIAIVDSGCDLQHPDLVNKYWSNDAENTGAHGICPNNSDDDGNRFIDDCMGWDWIEEDGFPSSEGSGHATEAAGIVAAETSNGIGIASVCPECRIACLRFINGREGKISDQVAAINYALDMKMRVSNNSYGGSGFSQLEYDVIKRARSHGHIFVASAGNSNRDTDSYNHTPSVYDLDNIIAVGASTNSGFKASFSNYGQTTVDIFAPGSGVRTTGYNGTYRNVSGTSFAAPMVAGAVGLIWSKYPDLTYVEVKECIVESCQKSRDLQDKAVCEGILDVAEALRLAGKKAKPQVVVRGSDLSQGEPTETTRVRWISANWWPWS